MQIYDAVYNDEWHDNDNYSGQLEEDGIQDSVTVIPAKQSLLSRVVRQSLDRSKLTLNIHIWQSHIYNKRLLP